ncbi:MAG: aminopeptidase P family protein [Deltaproteobacteria bacterium]|nr:aminopeptidase P family protein [Deltaproteobacteria bacterium]
MKKSFFRGRVTRLRETLDHANFDTVWITQPENRRYLSGFKAEDGQLTESSGSLLITKSASLLVTDSRYVTQAKSESVDFEVITLKNGLVKGLPELLVRLGTKCLGFEENYLTWELHRELTGRLRKLSHPVRLVTLKGLVEGHREVKDRDEVKAMEAASNLMSDILARVFMKLKPGLTEKQIAWQIEGLAREGGADSLAFPSIVASGPNSALPHAVPTDRKIRRKEPITFDVGVRIDGYCCDMTRTLFIGEPSAKLKTIYKTVRKAQLAALVDIQPGVDSTKPDSTAREIIRQAGFGDYFGHSLGHGVGLATHERPRLGPDKPVKLKEGMVVTVEPGIYIPPLGGVRLEEMVVIIKSGLRVLTGDDHFYDF